MSNPTPSEHVNETSPDTPKKWYKHPLSIAGAAVLAAGLTTGIAAAATSGNHAPNPVMPDGGTEAGATPNWNDPETFAGINNNLSGAEIKSIYSSFYGSYGDNPPFDISQFMDVMRNLSQDDADFVVRASQGSEPIFKAESLLKANGLVYDAGYTVE